MRVMVDKARRDDAPLGIDRALSSRARIFADPDDFAVLDRDVGLKRRLAGTVDNTPISDQQVECHCFPPVLGSAAAMDRFAEFSWLSRSPALA